MNAYGRDPESLLSAHAETIRRLAGAIVGNSHLAEEVAQDSLLVALRHPSPAGRAPRSWLAGIVRNVARNAIRGERRRRTRELRAAVQTPGPPTPTPLSHLERIETQRAVVDAVASLPEPQREAIALHYFEGLTIDAIAGRVGAPRETIRTRVRTGLVRLRRAFGTQKAGGTRRMVALTALSNWRPPMPVGAALGGVAMKKTTALALTAILLMATGAWWFFVRTPPSEPPSDAATETGEEAEPSPLLAGREGKKSAEVDVVSPARLTRLSGRVVDAATREPIPGARVRALSADFTSVLGHDDAALAATTAEADGRFELRFQDQAPAYVLIADAPQHSPRWIWVRPEGDVTISLDAPRTIAGHVRDVADRPIAGAVVRWRGVLGAIRHERETHTAADGSYRLVAPRVRGLDLISTLDVSATGFAPLQLRLSHVTSRPGDTTLDLLLLRGARLTGIVIDAETRRPIAGARVFLWSECGVTGVTRFDGGTALNPFWVRRLGVARTQETGGFAFEHVPAWNGLPLGIHTASRWTRRLGRIAAVADDHVLQVLDVSVPDDGQEVAVEFALERGATVRGRVIGEDGAGIGQVYVNWGLKGGASYGWIPSVFRVAPRGGATTDASGAYQLTDVGLSGEERGPVTLSAHREEPAWWHAQARVEIETIADRETEAPDLVLPARPQLPFVDLVVASEDGTPIAGAYQSGAVGANRSDEHGAMRVYFHAQEDGATRPVAVAVHALGYETATATVTPTMGSTPAVHVALSSAETAPGLEPIPPSEPPVTVLEGALTDARTGDPILKHRTTLLDAGGRDRHAARFAGPGRFLFQDVPDGSWTLRITAPGYDTIAREVRVSVSNPLPPLDLRLAGEDATRLCCRDEKGRPLRKARLMLSGEGKYVSGELDATDCVTLKGLKPGGRYEASCVRAPAHGPAQWFCRVPFEPLTLPTPGSGEPLDLTFQRAGVATLRIRSERLGLPVNEALLTPAQREARAGTRAWLVDAAGRRIWKRAHLRGSGWSLIGPQGRFTMRIEIPGAEPFTKEIVLDADPATVIVLDVP